MTYNVWNIDAIESYLKTMAEGDEPLMRLLGVALTKALQQHGPALKPMKASPKTAPGWLSAKFAQGMIFHTFDPDKDPALNGKVSHVRDWIKGAIVRGEDWTQQYKPQRLTHFKNN